MQATKAKPAVASRSVRARTWRRPRIAPYLFILPQIIVTAVFVLHPMTEAIRLSLYRWILSIGDPPQFAGAANYVALAEDRLFWRALTNTTIYVAGVVPATLAIGLGLALALNQPLGRFRTVYRSAYYVPVVVPTVVVALVWRFMLDPRSGVVNAALERLGVPQPAWFAEPRFAMLAVVLSSVWQQAGFVMVIYLAGLQGIPRVLHDAAAVDGAGSGQRFRDVTLPLLAPTTLFALVIGMINGFKVFDQAYVMTGGGPANGTLTIVQYLYVQAFELFDVGRGTAAATVLLALLAILTAAAMWLNQREELAL